MRRTLLVTVAASLVLAGCGGSDSEGTDTGTSDLSSVSVSNGATPKVKVGKDFSVSKTTSRVVKPGGGDEVYPGDTVTVKYVAINGRTGKQFDTSYSTGSAPALTLSATVTMKGIITGLTSQKIGSRVLVAISPEDGFGQALKQYDLKVDDTTVFLFDIVSKYPEGKAKALPKTVPSLDLDDQDHPTGFTNTSSITKKPTKPTIDVVNQGTGAKVESGQNVLFNYVGQVYGKKTVFDESWTQGPQKPYQLGTGAVIKCWDQLLVGQRLGSRVVLVCPADVAYKGTDKKPGAKFEPDDTLIFVVDLLAVY